MRAWIAALVATFAFAGVALADGPAEVPPLRPPPGTITPKIEPAATEAGQKGAVVLPAGMDYAVPPRFSYYSPRAAREYLDRAGRPAPEGEIQGLIAPANLQYGSPDFWGAVLAYDKMGHVRDQGAERLADPAFIAEVQAERRGKGQTPPDSLAMAPSYDANAKTLAWAESYVSTGPADKSTRHELRALGRYGVWSLTTLITPTRLEAVKANQESLLASLKFPAGRGYGDFVTGDKEADFDIAGLVSGKPFTLAAPPLPEPAPAKAANGWMSKAFPWIGAALVIIPAILWIIYGRRRRIDDDDEDPNLRPLG